MNPTLTDRYNYPTTATYKCRVQYNGRTIFSGTNIACSKFIKTQNRNIKAVAKIYA